MQIRNELTVIIKSIIVKMGILSKVRYDNGFTN
jgi:hypothetical protein